MDCLDENRVVELFERRLSEAEVAAIEAHTAGCEACRTLVAAYARMAAASPAVTSRMTAPFDSQILGAVPLRDASAKAPPPEDERLHLGRRVARAVAEKRVGTLLSGRWRVDRLIDTGGMAQVYAATHRNGHAVAVKVLRPELAVEPELVQRFLREGYVANKVQHPGAVAILDDDVAPDGAPFLVMELLVGRTLRTRVTSDGPVPVVAALRLTRAVLDVLSAAHARGIVHRDIKPENLFETSDGRLKVLDFGIARLRELAMGAADPERPADPSAHPSTQSGRTMGTIGYMAPEQARGEPTEVDARSDLWAAAATLYTLLTDQVLHDAPTTNAGLLLAMTVPVAPMRTLAPDLPASVAALLDRGLAFDKAGRFADAAEMSAAVDRALERLGSAASDVPAAAPRAEASPVAVLGGAGEARRGRRRLVGLTLAGVVVASAAGVALLREPSPRAGESPLPVGLVESAPSAALPAATQAPSAPALPPPAPETSTAQATEQARATTSTRKATESGARTMRAAPTSSGAPKGRTPPMGTGAPDPLGPRR